MNTTPDFRKLCAELVNELHIYKVLLSEHATDLVDRARTALATPPPEPVAYIHRQGNYWEPSERVLQDDEKERGWTEEPLYAATPPPEPPTDEELQTLWYELFDFDGSVGLVDVKVIARAALERWGNA